MIQNVEIVLADGRIIRAAVPAFASPGDPKVTITAVNVHPPYPLPAGMASVKIGSNGVIQINTDNIDSPAEPTPAQKGAN